LNPNPRKPDRVKGSTQSILLLAETMLESGIAVKVIDSGIPVIRLGFFYRYYNISEIGTCTI
jgi:hypothetical protein